MILHPVYGASGKANFGDSGFRAQILASRSLSTRCRCKFFPFNAMSAMIPESAFEEALVLIGGEVLAAAGVDELEVTDQARHFA